MCRLFAVLLPHNHSGMTALKKYRANRNCRDTAKEKSKEKKVVCGFAPAQPQRHDSLKKISGKSKLPRYRGGKK